MGYINATTTCLRRRTYAVWLLLALAPALAAAESWLAPGLALAPPENISIGYDTLEVLGGKPALVGYVDAKPAYFIAAEPLNAAIADDILWGKLEAGLRRRSDTHSFRLLASGGYQTQQGHALRYRIYSYIKNDQAHQQVFHLLKGTDSGYWIYATAVESVDLQALFPLIKTVLRRAELPSAQP